MNIITNTNIITYCCGSLLLVGGFLFIGLLVRMRKRPNNSYYEYPVNGKNVKEMYNGDGE